MMIKHYLKIGLRNLYLNKKYTILNILGLSLGLSFSILIFLLIANELTYDHYHENIDQIYRLYQKDLQNNVFSASSPMPTASVLRKDFPEIKSVVGFSGGSGTFQNEEGKEFTVTQYSVEPEVFEMFSFKLIYGNLATVLNNPFDIVITESFAEKFFGKTDVNGQIIKYKGQVFTITGVIKDIPVNSIFKFDILISDKIRKLEYPDYDQRWWHGGPMLFITFHNKKSAENFNEKLKIIPENYFPDYMKGGSSFEIYPFKKSHFFPTVYDIEPFVSYKYIYTLIIIALGVLLIALINFINLATSQTRKRIKETGIRKVAGAKRYQIFLQYLYEFFIITGLSIIIALILAELFFPFFQRLIHKEIQFSYSESIIVIGVVGIALLTTIGSGIYPSIYLSGFSPLKLFQYKVRIHSERSIFRKAFVITQYVIASVLIICMIMIYKQIHFMKTHSVGFDRENLVSIELYQIEDNPNERYKKAKTYRDQITNQYSHIFESKGTITENIPGTYYQNFFKIHPEGILANDGVRIKSTAVDENYLDIFKIGLIDGRFFSPEISTDRYSLIINEKAMHTFQWNTIEDKWIQFDYETGGYKYPVIGLLKDINSSSFHNEVAPLLLKFGQHNNFPGYITYRLKDNKIQESLDILETVWQEHFPEVDFNYFFVEDEYLNKYGEEENLVKIIGIFSLLAIIICCIGLFAQISYSAEQRTKEIGIRKVNGALVTDILKLLIKDLTTCIFLGALIAIPISYYAIQKWLNGFTIKTPFSFWVPIIALTVILMISYFTVIWQSLKAANKNPVESLRYE